MYSLLRRRNWCNILAMRYSEVIVQATFPNGQGSSVIGKPVQDFSPATKVDQ